MRHLKYIFPILCLVFFSTSNAQDIKSFLLEIEHNDYMPVLDNTTGFYKIESSLRGANDINTQFSSLHLFDAIDINTIDLKETSNLVFISISDTDHDEIYTTLDYLINNYTYYIGYTEIETYETLAPPNDFENASGFWISDPNQYELKMIRAEEAWDLTTGDPNVIIGIADTGFHVPNDDLVTEIIGGIGNYETVAGYGPNHWNIGKHGTRVSSMASGATNNGTGSASIGYNTKMTAMFSTSAYGLKLLSNQGAKVVNGSFGGPVNSINNDSGQDNINDIINNGTVVVVAAGNGPASGNSSTGLNGVISNESYASRYYLPASYKDVISVSSVGDKNDIGSTAIDYYNWKGVHKLATEAVFPNGGSYSQSGGVPINEPFVTTQHNDSVDIVVPAYRGSPYALNNNVPNYNFTHPSKDGILGTSFAAPIVSGTVGLMFSVNYCLTPKEVESILKLTAVKIDNMPENLEYYGRLGAGMLDAYEAVKMSKDMADDFGSVEVKDRILYRWFYKLETAPYEIKMANNDVTGNARLKFRARNNIEVLSGDYYPETGGYIDLSIDSTLPLDNCPPPVSLARIADTNKSSTTSLTGLKYSIYPTLVDKSMTFEKLDDRNNQAVAIKIFDFYGNLVFEDSNIKDSKTILNLEKLVSGIYIVKIYDSRNKELETLKVVKK
jgi:hypothetical protein